VHFAAPLCSTVTLNFDLWNPIFDLHGPPKVHRWCKFGETPSISFCVVVLRFGCINTRTDTQTDAKHNASSALPGGSMKIASARVAYTRSRLTLLSPKIYCHHVQQTVANHTNLQLLTMWCSSWNADNRHALNLLLTGRQ